MKTMKLSCIALVAFVLGALVFAPVSTAQTEAFSPALQKVIEGAKKEGTVNIRLTLGLPEKTASRLRKEIKEWSGVDLKINNITLEEPLSRAIMEKQSGIVPSYDMAMESTLVAQEGIEAGVFASVDWKALLTPQTPIGVVIEIPPYGQVGVSHHTTSAIYMYNPQKVSPEELPKSFMDLASPKWKNRYGMTFFSSPPARAAHWLGKDAVFPALRATIKNGAIIGSPPQILDRYLLGEIWLCRLPDTSMYLRALKQGAQAKWHIFGLLDQDVRPLLLRVDAPHANAAKLVAIYVVSPPGYKLMYEERELANYAYTGGLEEQIAQEAKRLDLPIYQRWRDQDLNKFLKTPEWKALKNESRSILRGR